MCEQEYAQAGLERMQQLEEALNRAEAGCANADDWKIIRFECGMSTNVNLNKGKKYVSYSLSK